MPSIIPIFGMQIGTIKETGPNRAQFFWIKIKLFFVHFFDCPSIIPVIECSRVQKLDGTSFHPSVSILATNSVSFPTPGTKKSVFFPALSGRGGGGSGQNIYGCILHRRVNQVDIDAFSLIEVRLSVEGCVFVMSHDIIA